MRFFRDKAAQRPVSSAPLPPGDPSAGDETAESDDGWEDEGDLASSVGETGEAAPSGQAATQDAYAPGPQDPFAARARLRSYPARGPVRRRIWDLEDEDENGATSRSGVPHAQTDDHRDVLQSEGAMGESLVIGEAGEAPDEGRAEPEEFLPDLSEAQPFPNPQEEQSRSEPAASRLGNTRLVTLTDPQPERPPSHPSAGQPAPGSAVPSEECVAEARAQLARMSGLGIAMSPNRNSNPPASPETGDLAEAASTSSKETAGGPARVQGSSRTQTRLLGFQARSLADQDPFSRGRTAHRNGTESSQGAEFPVGWIVVVSGPGRGASFVLQAGVSSVGRGTDQRIRLDFGDTSISRENHASIAFDDETERFFLGQGGKSNLVRLNERPVLSTEDLSDGDIIRIGETTLRFVALCGEDFSWKSDAGTRAGSEAADVAAR